MSATVPQQLPVLDLAQLDADGSQRQDFLAQLRHAAHDMGFFYLTGHGIDKELLDEVRQISREFFALPLAEKLAVQMIRSPHFRGYSLAAAEYTRGGQDWREQFDIGAERLTRTLMADSPAWARLQGPNLWPDDVLPRLRPVLLQWQQAMTRTTQRLLRAFALALGLEETAFDALYGSQPNEHAKIIRYPGRDQTGSDQGVGPHKDSGFITFVLQDTQSGLQVEDKEGRWIDAPPMDGTFVVNIGELLELATNGYLRATVHQVITPPSGAERLSAAFFLGAQLDAVIPVFQLPKELADQASGPDTDPHNPLLRDVGWNYLKGRLRSHPDVAQRYYADVLESGTVSSA